MLLISYMALSIVYLTPVFLIILIISEVAAILLTFGFSWEVHKEHTRLLGFAWHFLFPSGKGGYYDRVS